MAIMTSFLAALLVFILFSPTCCLNPKKLPSSGIQGSLVEEKTRLGSTPPSCYNKCNNCHPCMAVQVPTIPSHNQLRPAAEPATAVENNLEYSSPYSSGGGGNNRYSNYKPLGWKCRCDGHFYNP